MSLGYLDWLIQICKHNNNDNLTKNYLQTCLQVRKLANLNHKAVFFSTHFYFLTPALTPKEIRICYKFISVL